MTSYVTPRKGVEFIFYVGLFSQANTKILQANPTLAAGDAKVSIDGGAFANLANLPAVTPASGKSIKIILSASEMNGDNITVVLSDASGDEWCDLAVNIQTTAQQIDDIPNAAAVNAEIVDVLRTDTIPDSYAADGAQPTFAQAVLAIHQFLMEKAVSGTTVTVKKPDGSTTAMTFTLNDGSSPSSITRAG